MRLRWRKVNGREEKRSTMISKPRLMEMNETERRVYFSALYAVFGEDIIRSERGLSTGFQREWEVLRHRFNSRLGIEIPGTHLAPERLLIGTTQKCPFSCSHCWVFASPQADCSLSIEDLDAIYEHTSANSTMRWTMSGGEFFTLPYYTEILEKYPIDCVFTNGFWGFPETRCRKFVENISSALAMNSYTKDHPLTLILSYDTFHLKSSGEEQDLTAAIANIIACFYETFPEIKIRISHSQCCPPDTNFVDVFTVLTEKGFTISPPDQHTQNANIQNILYSYQRRGSPKLELWVDTYPTSQVCRALIHNHRPDPAQKTIQLAAMPSPRTRYQYTVGPDGGVGMYQILYAPPVPYWLGDLVCEPWSRIAERATRDPIALSLIYNGIDPIIEFMEQYYPVLLQAITSSLPVTQSFLYHVLLDPTRRLHLNSYLLMKLSDQGYLTCIEMDIFESVKRSLRMKTRDDCQKAAFDLYGKPFGKTGQ